MAYSHTTKKTIESKTCPGVSYTLRAVSYGHRLRIAERLADTFEKSGLRLEQPDTIDTARALALQHDVDRIQIAEVLLGVRGLEVDGHSFDGDIEKRGAEGIAELLDNAPGRLVSEIRQAIERELGLSAEEAKN